MTFPEQSPSKIILITGANSGLGYYTALRLAQLKAHVVLACRSTDKCAAARQSILDLHPEALVDAMQLDLSSFESIRMFSTTFNKSYESLDVLVNNAGIMALPTRETTKDGLEAQIGTNHFGHYLLTCLLFPKLTANGRIINHASGAHLFHAEGFPFENAQMETGYSAWTAYGNSKVANLLFTFELNRRLSGRNISAYAVHPGYTATNLQVLVIDFSLSPFTP
ncbi:hypothetical protein B484DRAFT_338823 [Ochromonadaceae sp. CCMP2298]|nr:hypothetical protein B484DRAFT_338823 [Ochromonadaceae sp. CCMP2298]